MAPRRGRPAKRARRNISGLKNQPRQESSPESPARSPSPTDSLGDYSDTQIPDDLELDSIMYLEVDTDHDDNDNEADWDEIAEAEFNNRLLEMIAQMEEDRLDADDNDWMPTNEAYEARCKADRRVPRGRPKHYIKGPDTGSKSSRTQRQYAAINKKQGKLNDFVTQGSASKPDALPKSDPEVEINLNLGLQSQPSLTPASTAPPSRAPSPDNSDEEMEDEDPNNWDIIIDDMVGGEDQSRSESSSVASGSSSHMAQPDQSGEKPVKLQSWHALREKVKTDLKKRNLPLTQLNQLLIIRNFATLLIQGLKRIQASPENARHWHEGGGNYFARRVRALVRHYQIFGELPLETRGGRANTKSLLNDESVQTACSAWLRVQKAGSVTPAKFREAVNTEILASLGISPKKPISERTARRWLMAEFKARMTKYEANVLPATEPGGKPVTVLEPVEPQLPPGVKKVIAYFHDECCFHALDYMRSAWLAEGQTVLQKKSRGRLIHVSDFITEGTG
ncbi:hypothetical protein B0H16DRAFT_1702766 [Mycena metata]|uniref:Uncharacterized protein n=1 Tax=Mycena metata TaxID=1033252 RepID=A0AAD7H6E6_9AGAR|nr:hypothetical protein B0H16DRAFT_1702766 [Mycena metata]